MQQVKISQLPYVTSSGLTNDDIFPIVNYDTLLGTTKHTKITDLKDYVLSGVTFGSTFTGGTVTGSTNFTNGLTSNTFTTSAITLNGITITGFTSNTFTGNTSATCITDLYVENIYGCSPITIHDSLQTTTSTAIGTSSVAFGNNTKSYGNYSHSKGYSTISGWKGFEIDSFIDGLITLKARYGDVTSEFSTKVIFDTSTEKSFYIYSVNYDSILSATTIQLSDTTTNVSPIYVAEWNNLESFYADILLGDSNNSEGKITTSVGDYSHSEGFDTISYGPSSHSEGLENQSYGIASHSEGAITRAFGNYSHSEGRGTEVYGESSHSEGYDNIVYGNSSHSEGFNTKTGFMGFQTTGLTGGNQIELHSKYGDVTFEFGGSLISDIDGGLYTYPISAVTYNGVFTTIIIYGSFGSSSASVASINNLYSLFADVPSRFASHSEGASTKAIGDMSHSEGYGTISYGPTSHSEGSQTFTYGEASHSEGFNTVAYSSGSHAEGSHTSAGWRGFEITGITNGLITIVSRYGNITGEFAIDEQILVYNGLSSSVETISGRTFNGIYTIIQLYNTSLNGNSYYVITHPVNYDDISPLADVPIGGMSHSNGSYTKAISYSSYAGGTGTVSAGVNQFVIGQYNTVSSTNGAFIIGNGTDNGNNNRSNLLFAGNNQVNISGKTITTNLQVTSSPSPGYVLTSDASGNATWQQSQDVTTLGTGLTIHFSAKTIFNLPSSPATGNVSGDTTNAKLGLIQKLYHSGSTEPTFPVTWKLVGEGVYYTNEINIIYAEYVEPTWIEYWIIQQQ